MAKRKAVYDKIQAILHEDLPFAPIFAYVRAAREEINERGVVRCPDLVIVADDSLVAVPAAGVMQGIDAHTVLLINSHESADTWSERLNTKATILILPAAEEVEDRAELPYIGSSCAAARAASVAARVVRVASVAAE